MNPVQTQKSYCFAALEWPFRLHAKVLRTPKPDDVAEILRRAKKIHEVAISQRAQLIELELVNARLQKEIESMRCLTNSAGLSDGKS